MALPVQPENGQESSSPLAAAEQFLDWQEFEEAEKKAEQVLADADLSQDSWAAAEAFRCLGLARIGQARVLYEDGLVWEARDILNVLESAAEDRLDEAVRSASSSSSPSVALDVGILTLLLAETRAARGPAEEVEEAIDLANEAISDFFFPLPNGTSDPNNPKSSEFSQKSPGTFGDMDRRCSYWRGHAHVALSNMSLRLRHIAAARRDAEGALEVFTELNEARGQALALGALADVYKLDIRPDEGQRVAKQRLKITRQARLRGQELATSVSLAAVLFRRGDDLGASKAAQEALNTWRDCSESSVGQPVGHSFVLEAYSILVDALIGLEQLQAAEEAVARASETFPLSNSTSVTREGLRSQLLLVKIHMGCERWAEASDAGEDLLRTLESSRAAKRHPAMQAKLLEFLAETALAAEDFQSARDYTSKACDVLRSARAEELEGQAKTSLATRIYVQLGDIPAAIQASTEAVEIARSLKDELLEAKALHAQCLAQGFAGNFDRALKSGNLALDLFRSLGSCCRQEEVKLSRSLSEIHLAAGNASQALKCLEQAELLLRSYRETKDLVLLTQTKFKILLQLRDPQKALETATAALKSSRSCDDFEGVLTCLFLVVEAQTEILIAPDNEKTARRVFARRCEKAERIAHEALLTAQRLKDRHSEGTAFIWLAQLQIMGGKLEEADFSGSRAEAILHEVEDKIGEAQSISMQASVAVQRGDNPKAIERLTAGLQIAHSSKDKELIAILEEKLSKLKTAPKAGKAAVATAETAQDSDEPAVGGPPAEETSSAAVAAYTPPDPEMVKTFIVALVHNMVGTGDEVDPDEPLMESGVDSLASVELRTMLQKEFQISLPSTVMFNYPTITAMSDFLVDECTTKQISWTAS